MLQVVHLRTEHLTDPLGIGKLRPRLSWQLQSDRPNTMQRSYRIEASHRLDFQEILWDSGEVASDESLCVKYGGPALASRERVYWRVKVASDKEMSAYSAPAFFEMGLLAPSDWRAHWIEPEGKIDLDAMKPSPYLRKRFSVGSGLCAARLYATAHGLYEFYLNGTIGSNDRFAPGFTSYYHRLQIGCYDITELLREGDNVLGVILGDGWWRGSTGGMALKNNFGPRVGFLGQIELHYANGTTETIGSDATFLTSEGPILFSDFRHGEHYDARAELLHWAETDFDDSAWRPVQEVSYDLSNLIAAEGVPVRTHEAFTPKILHALNGGTVLDFGQNISGFVEMRVQGPAGKKVTMIHGEVLNILGDFSLFNIATGKDIGRFQEVTYILKGGEPEVYRPHFCVFGFRYVLLKGYPGRVRPENFRAIAVYSDMDTLGEFSCSNKLINRFVENTRWSLKSNFIDIPTDCPTRERAGWTGDAQLFSATAAYLMDVYPFFEKWMQDVSLEQAENGVVLNTAPCVMGYHDKEERRRVQDKSGSTMTDELFTSGPNQPNRFDGSAGWGDAAVIVPYTMYLSCGDPTILENQYESAKAWVNYCIAEAKKPNPVHREKAYYHSFTDGVCDGEYIYDSNYHWGEWLEADLDIFKWSKNGLDDFFRERMEGGDALVATAYLAYSAHLLSKMAAVLGKTDDRAYYASIFEKVKLVYNKHFIGSDGTIMGDRQAPNVRVLAFSLADEGKEKAVAARLAALVRKAFYHLNTGFLSTPFILPMLCKYGYTEEAYRVLLQTACPSWLYAVKKGLTTIPEMWGFYAFHFLPIGSMNHYAYGAGCGFLFSDVAGIKPMEDHPGYKHFEIRPYVGGTLQYASASYRCGFGLIESSFERRGKKITYRFTVPPNTLASVSLAASRDSLPEVRRAHPDAEWAKGRIRFEVGSGTYHLTI